MPSYQAAPLPQAGPSEASASASPVRTNLSAIEDRYVFSSPYEVTQEDVDDWEGLLNGKYADSGEEYSLAYEQTDGLELLFPSPGSNTSDQNPSYAQTSPQQTRTRIVDYEEEELYYHNEQPQGQIPIGVTMDMIDCSPQMRATQPPTRKCKKGHEFTDKIHRIMSGSSRVVTWLIGEVRHSGRLFTGGLLIDTRHRDFELYFGNIANLSKAVSLYGFHRYTDRRTRHIHVNHPWLTDLDSLLFISRKCLHKGRATRPTKCEECVCKLSELDRNSD